MLDKKYEELEKLAEDEKLKDITSEHLISYWKYLNIQKYCEKDDAIKFFINDEKGKVDFVSNIEKEIFQLKGKRVLDIGCGTGGVVISCALRGANAFGFDADGEELKIAKLRMKSYRVDNISIFKGDGEHIPFPDNSFDLVTATSVLEHVKNLEGVIKEMVRVTKPGGFCCSTTPNPLFPREAHYKVFYVPYLPKSVGKVYLRLRGFNPDFFMRGVEYPYPSIYKITTIYRKNGMEVINSTEKWFLTKFEYPSLIKSKRMKKLVKYLKALRVNCFIAKLLVHLPFYSGVRMVAKKGGGE
jgi:ubiquinone/menaquinone biosynthesis C-methylase UbiE